MLKFLIFLLAVFGGVWWWRKRQSQQTPEIKTKPSKQTAESAQAMINCHHCGLHFPQQEAVQGRLGAYCSSEHLQIKETNA